jgi:hypothetical protein
MRYRTFKLIFFNGQKLKIYSGLTSDKKVCLDQLYYFDGKTNINSIF